MTNTLIKRGYLSLVICTILAAPAAVLAADSHEHAHGHKHEHNSSSSEAAVAPGFSARPLLNIYKSPTCGCCKDWVTHAEQGGFATRVTDTQDMNAVKMKHNIEPRFQSCHTAVTSQGDYFFEGHVPASVMQRFLKEKPANAVGLAVPGMPLGSPGMEMGGRFQPYDVLQINNDGSTKVFATISKPEDQY